MPYLTESSAFPHDLRRPRVRLSLWVLVSVAAGLSACSSLSEKLPSMQGIGNIVKPYKMDIQQGNVVTREQAQALQPGMPRLQVRDLLGSPLLSSVFHADRWDYVFTLRRQGQEPQVRKLTVFFKDGVLERFDADELPSEADFVASLDTGRKFAQPKPLVATEEQLKVFQERNKPLSGSATTVPDAAPGISYPPLEPEGASR